MNDLATVKVQIERAFRHGVYPGDWCLAGSREGTEPGLLEEAFRGKTDWRTLDPSFLDGAPGGLGPALSFFSDEAFRFYLPAYLLADLDGELEHVDVVYVLTHGLDDASRGERINPQRYGERTWFEHTRHKFAVFDGREAGAIVAYLRYKRDTDEVMDFEKTRIEEALENYWSARTDPSLMLSAGYSREHAAESNSKEHHAMSAHVQYLNPDGLHRNPAFSQVVVTQGPVRTVYVGGQNALDASGEVVGKGDIGAQAEQIFRNLENALEAGGARLDDVVKWNVYAVDGQPPQPAFEVFQRVWGSRPNPPLITMLFVSALAHPDFLLEIDAVAVVPQG